MTVLHHKTDVIAADDDVSKMAVCFVVCFDNRKHYHQQVLTNYIISNKRGGDLNGGMFG